jgi:hypothetical protein
MDGRGRARGLPEREVAFLFCVRKDRASGGVPRAQACFSMTFRLQVDPAPPRVRGSCFLSAASASTAEALSSVLCTGGGDGRRGSSVHCRTYRIVAYLGRVVLGFVALGGGRGLTPRGWVRE